MDCYKSARAKVAPWGLVAIMSIVGHRETHGYRALNLLSAGFNPINECGQSTRSVRHPPCCDAHRCTMCVATGHTPSLGMLHPKTTVTHMQDTRKTRQRLQLLSRTSRPTLSAKRWLPRRRRRGRCPCSIRRSRGVLVLESRNKGFRTGYSWSACQETARKSFSTSSQGMPASSIGLCGA